MNKQDTHYDGWNIALAVSDILTCDESWRRHVVDFYEAVGLNNVFPRASHPDPNEIIPDSIIPWLRQKNR